MVAESRLHVDHVMPIISRMKAMVPSQISSTTDQMVANEDSDFLAESSDDILQCVYGTHAPDSSSPFIAFLSRFYEIYYVQS